LNGITGEFPVPEKDEMIKKWSRILNGIAMGLSRVRDEIVKSEHISCTAWKHETAVDQ
jgi:hypothetical protein